jgi:hypothetical protein
MGLNFFLLSTNNAGRRTLGHILAVAGGPVRRNPLAERHSGRGVIEELFGSLTSNPEMRGLCCKKLDTQLYIFPQCQHSCNPPITTMSKKFSPI